MYSIKKSIIVLLTIPFICFSQQQNDTVQIKKNLQEINISALRANEKTPVTFTNINKQKIDEVNLGQDLPYIISLSPSVVTTSDAGAGIGYTGFRIRGSDQTRINVTVNGIPLNDSESQGVWWVNMPDFSSSVESIQIQRGVGTSSNGASAFGASVNLQTDKFNKEAYLNTSNTIGSFSTTKNNLEFGTGLLNNKIAFDGRLSQISSEGYIDRASSELKSLYLQGSYINESTAIKALMFAGNERTYQAWNGVPLNFLDSNRTFNSYTYDNEVDNYHQTHYQLHYRKNVNSKTNYNLAIHYTHGEGYYEQEKISENLSNYGLEDIIFSNDTIKESNLIRRKWLDNDFGGLTYSLHHNINNVDLVFGGASNKYSGQHFGNIIWIQYASNSNFDHQYYWNKAEKIDNNFYAKANYRYSSFTNLYIDLQNRNIDYTFSGYDEFGEISDQHVSLKFFNPKLGVFHMLNNKQSVYASFAIGNKEPNRNDYVESTPNSRPQHETLFDTEIGFKQSGEKSSLAINLYQMNYENQLVLTGEINDVGANTRTNIKESFRNGLEIEGTYQLTNKINWAGNVTFSNNKIVSHIAYIDNWDTGLQETINYKNTDLAFSPSLIWASHFNMKVSNTASIDFISKYVGEQFIDNTSSNDRLLEDYLINNLRLSYNLQSKLFKTAKLSLQINNLLNNEYVNNAWVYRFISDGWDPRGGDNYVNIDSERGYNMAGYFPQATRNYLLALTLGI